MGIRSLVFGVVFGAAVWLIQGAFGFLEVAFDEGLTTPPLARAAIAIGAGIVAFMIHRFGFDTRRR